MHLVIDSVSYLMGNNNKCIIFQYVKYFLDVLYFNGFVRTQLCFTSKHLDINTLYCNCNLEKEYLSYSKY